MLNTLHCMLLELPVFFRTNSHHQVVKNSDAKAISDGTDFPKIIILSLLWPELICVRPSDIFRA